MLNSGDLIIHRGKDIVGYDIERKCMVNDNLEGIKSDLLIEKRKQSIHAIAKPYNWTLAAEHHELLEWTTLAHAMRVHYRMDLCQTPSLPETSVRRALLSGNIPKKVLLIGDDDLVSVPLAFLGHEVTVMDYDEYLIELIEQINIKFNLNIKVLHQNLMERVPSCYQGHFDILYSDPVSTTEGFEAFIGKGMQMLKADGVSYISVSQRFSPIFELFCSTNSMLVKHKFNKFSHYYDHRHVVIDDISDLFEVYKSEYTILKYSLADVINQDIFESQKNLTFNTTAEIFNLESTDKVMTKAFIKEKLFGFLTNKPTVCTEIIGKGFEKSILHDKDTNTTLELTLWQTQNMQITLISQNVCEVSKFKHFLNKVFSSQEHRYEQVIFGIEKLQSREDLVVNEIY